MKPVNFKLLTYIDFRTENNDVNTKFKVDDHVGISQYKNIFAKSYKPSWSEVFVIEKIKIIVLWIYVIEDLNGKEIVGRFYEKELERMKKNCKRQIKEKLELRK